MAQVEADFVDEEEEQLPSNYRPQKIQLFFNGLEVFRIEDGIKVYEQLVPEDWRPDSMQLFWDGQEVYALRLRPKKDGDKEYKIATNRLADVVQAHTLSRQF